ncbi:UNVERIFIED_CONTAM: hypothetical protein GTU68_037036 [Idotea baltica]|nr:hypothetical protein [Idotea baltica]
MKIYTRKGDEGKTGLIGGTRVPKYDLRIEAYGTVDELNSWLGLIGEQAEALEFQSLIRQIQSNLFTIGSHLATDPDNSHFKLPEIHQDEIDLLEKSMDNMNEELPELKQFVLPGGNKANAHAHVARCVCRRAERRIVELNENHSVHSIILPYINRLSDWLFVLGRHFSHITDSPEVPWSP